MSRSQSTAGYTLVEALASLTLLGLISLLLLTGLYTARQRLARIGASDETGVEASEQILRARIERSSPQTTLQTPAAMIDFDGTGDRLEFSAPPPSAHGPDGMFRYRLYLAGDGELRLDGFNDLALDQSRPASRDVLLNGVTTLDLAYFGGRVGGAPASWTDHWQQETSLPQLVRVRVGFGPGDHRRWPTLIIHPAATIDTACVIDPNTGGCQGRT
jgi:type II secretory pathway pseudopilin PulG